jgi:anti-anti-sigma factor
MSLVIRIIQPFNSSDVESVPQFHSEMENILALGTDVVLVDLKNITSISSPNFIALAKALRTVQASVKQLFICSMTAQMRMLFELTGLDQIFTILTDPDEVHRHIQSTHHVPSSSKVETLRPAKTNLKKLQLAG